jgi:acyl-CoA thioesterase
MSDASTRIHHLAGRDAFARHLGAELVEAGLGRAVVELTVAPEHLNFNGTCHGGVVFSLADTAFGLASNSHGAVAAAIDAHIGYPAPARKGDRLTATATEVTRSSQLALYRVDVRRGDGTVVGAFTGTVYITRREHES